jgi:phenylalanyl-tRNA synthetase alpha chain
VVPRSFRPFSGEKAFFIFCKAWGLNVRVSPFHASPEYAVRFILRRRQKEMKEKLEALRQEALDQLHGVKGVQTLNDLRVKYLGKKGALTEVLRGMGSLSAEERPKIGQVANEVRGAIEALIESKQEAFQKAETEKRLQAEKIDVTLPGRKMEQGGIHPLNKVIEEMEEIFIGMGYHIAEGPEVETDYYNFEALNLPKNHPARDMQDTFYITEEILMRTQTSPMQIRTMEKMQGEVPVKIICPGKVYRRDDDDATHSFQFNQIEGLVIGENIRMSDLKGTLLQFMQEMFGPSTQIRLRPSFFPFTEPSAEVDVTCVKCGGDGCRICKHTGWLEILGCGMVHPKVLEMGGYDPEKYSGFAFGMGVERIAILKYGIDDIRHFYSSDMAFLKQFARK